MSLGPHLKLRALLLLNYIYLVIVNAWAGAEGTNTEVSNKYETPLTPAGWAFSIWGIIFMLQGVFTVWACLPQGYESEGQENGKSIVLVALAAPISAVWFLQCAWQFAFSAEHFIPSTVIIVAAYITVVLAWYRLCQAEEYMLSKGINLPFVGLTGFWGTSINAGWLSAATCLQLLITPISYGATDDDIQPFIYILPVAITGVAVFVAIWKREVLYPATLIWALTAIKDKQHERTGVVVTAEIATGICVLFASISVIRCAYTWYDRRQSPQGDGLNQPMITASQGNFA